MIKLSFKIIKKYKTMISHFKKPSDNELAEIENL